MYKLYNCDFRDKINEIAKEYKNRQIIIVSDPPFNIGYHYEGYTDKLTDAEYYEMLKQAFEKFPSVIIHYPEELYRIAFHIKKTPERVVSWVYNSNTAKQHRDIAFFDVKPDFSKVRQPYKNPNDKRIQERIARGCKGAKLYDWWNINQIKNVSNEKTKHPCQMPIEVMKNIIGILPDDCIVIDPFTGSGTTGAACVELQKDFIGFEIVNEYYEIAKKRLYELQTKNDNLNL